LVRHAFAVASEQRIAVVVAAAAVVVLLHTAAVVQHTVADIVHIARHTVLVSVEEQVEHEQVE
jgi:hypothetical protein